MNKALSLLIILLIFCFVTSCSGGKRAEADIYFFYLELCPGCEDYENAERLSASVLKLGGKAVNIIHDEDAKMMKDILTAKNFEDISHSLPLLIVEDTYYVGYEEISDIVKSLEEDQ